MNPIFRELMEERDHWRDLARSLTDQVAALADDNAELRRAVEHTTDENTKLWNRVSIFEGQGLDAAFGRVEMDAAKYQTPAPDWLPDRSAFIFQPQADETTLRTETGAVYAPAVTKSLTPSEPTHAERHAEGEDTHQAEVEEAPSPLESPPEEPFEF